MRGGLLVDSPGLEVFAAERAYTRREVGPGSRHMHGHST